MTDFVHVPVMLEECLAWLVPPRPEALMVDCTLGEGGHAEAFLGRYPGLRYAGIDADPRIQAKAKLRLATFAGRVSFLSGYFDEVLGGWLEGSLLAEGAALGAEARPDLVLFDLGISMHHYLESGRGFGFGKDEALDMRLSPAAPRSAADLVNEEGEEVLARLIYEYGEERYSRRIARALVAARRQALVQDTGRLAEIVAAAVPPEYRRGRIHPATRTFQALRIAVNDELGRAERGIAAAAKLLAPGGLLGVISFHSLEDRVAKRLFKALSTRDESEEGVYAGLPPSARSSFGAGSVAAAEPEYELVLKKALEASAAEAERNPPSRSAKLRVLRRRPSGGRP